MQGAASAATAGAATACACPRRAFSAPAHCHCPCPCLLFARAAHHKLVHSGKPHATANCACLHRNQTQSYAEIVTTNCACFHRNQTESHAEIVTTNCAGITTNCACFHRNQTESHAEILLPHPRHYLDMLAARVSASLVGCDMLAVQAGGAGQGGRTRVVQGGAQAVSQEPTATNH